MDSLKIVGDWNSSEKKLYLGLKEKIGLEMSDEVNSILDFSQVTV